MALVTLTPHAKSKMAAGGPKMANRVEKGCTTPRSLGALINFQKISFFILSSPSVRKVDNREGKRITSLVALVTLTPHAKSRMAAGGPKMADRVYYT